MNGAARAASALLLLLFAACRDPVAPTPKAGVTVYSGADQYAVPGASLDQPLQVIVLDAARRPRAGVTVRWRVTQGRGAVLGASTTTTGSDGVAGATLRLGQDTGRYEVQASIENMTGDAARFPVRAVHRPVIVSVAPTAAAVSDTITITGQNFSTDPAENVVWFDGFRGTVVTAARTELRVVVPACMPTRTASVAVALGSVASNAVPVDIDGDDEANLSLQPGGVIRLTDGAAMACQRVPAEPGAAYLAIPQNVSAIAGTITPFSLGSYVRGTTSLTASIAARPTPDLAAEWEARLRARERAFERHVVDAPVRLESVVMADPKIGDRRRFKVLNRDDRFSDVEAEVRHISNRAIFYVDLNAPQNGFSDADLQGIGNTFDSMIWPVDIEHFGSPSDIDGNGKVIILMTPVVNELTPAGANSFIGGFFYACDLMSRDDCSGSNRGEVFYLLVPDPLGRHGNIRTRATVVNAILPILAHEFQHMIHYAVRGRLDALWLAEGLAHMAEDLVADAFALTGDSAATRQYRIANYNRAVRFLRDTTTSLVSEELPGSVEQRGAAWLLLKYLQGQFGNDVLRTITTSTRSSTDNVARATGRSWEELLSDWAVALWADDAPVFQNGGIAARHTFPNLNLRRDLTGDAAYPLAVTNASFADSGVTGALRPSTQRFVYFEAQGTPASPLTLVMTGALGVPFDADDAMQLTILRVK